MLYSINTGLVTSVVAVLSGVTVSSSTLTMLAAEAHAASVSHQAVDILLDHSSSHDPPMWDKTSWLLICVWNPPVIVYLSAIFANLNARRSFQDSFGGALSLTTSTLDNSYHGMLSSRTQRTDNTFDYSQVVPVFHNGYSSSLITSLPKKIKISTSVIEDQASSEHSIHTKV
jgi:hypothetical protein